MALGQMFLFPIEAPPAPVVMAPAQIAASRAPASQLLASQLLASQLLASQLPPSRIPASKSTASRAPTPSEPALFGGIPAAPACPLTGSGPHTGSEAKPLVEQLRAQMQRIQARGVRGEADEVEPCYSAGGAVLDAMLPHRGLRRGTIVQWTGDVQGSGAGALSIIAAAEIARSEISGGKPLVIFDSERNFYPPAAIALGIPAERMVIVQKSRDHRQADMVWAIDQALRCSAVAAVWVEIGAWLNDRDARRLQLAAEAGGTVGLFVRPAAVRGRPSFADVNWHVSEQGPASYVGLVDRSHRRLRVQIDRCRGGAEGAVAAIEIRSDSAADRKVILAASSPNSLLIENQTKNHHEPTLASDLAHRLANPTVAKRGPAKRSYRDARRAS